jgi:hypothetical protein
VSEYSPGGLEAGPKSECGYCGDAGKNPLVQISDMACLADFCLILLKFLFLEPNASDPLNKEAAEDLRTNREGFKRNVRTSMGGGTVRGVQFERVTR